MPSPSFVHKDLGKAKIKRELKGLSTRVALVGIPGGLEAGKTTLATIALVLEKGSEVMKIPPRPFMRQTRDAAAHGRFAKLMRQYYQLVTEKKMPAEQALKRLGAAYVGEMQGTIISGDFKANAPITIHGGWMRNRISGRPFKVDGKHSTRPLIDTGRLRQSITFKVAGAKEAK